MAVIDLTAFLSITFREMDCVVKHSVIYSWVQLGMTPKACARLDHTQRVLADKDNRISYIHSLQTVMSAVGASNSDPLTSKPLVKNRLCAWLPGQSAHEGMHKTYSLSKVI